LTGRRPNPLPCVTLVMRDAATANGLILLAVVTHIFDMK
jgi:hypothetical protein